MQTKVNRIVFVIFIFFLNIFLGFSQEIPEQNLSVPPVIAKDSVQPTTNNLPKKNKQKIQGEIFRSAKGYEKIDQEKKIITLYDEAVFKYLNYELKAGIIVYNYDKEELYAGRIRDSIGELSQIPVFKEGNQVVTPDSIRFNLKSYKAIVWNSRTSYDEFNIQAERTKRINDSLYYMRNIKFTTAKDIDNPEYYFRTNKLKYVPNDKVVTGPTQMVVADVPTPLVLPFAFFPITKKAVSGFIFPSFGDSNDRGYYFQNGGYYFALSEHFDLTLLGDYYTNGSHTFSAQTNYAKRYKYRGSATFSLENIITSEIGFPDYKKSVKYNITWNHSQDAKASPSSNFSASVNLGSSDYYRNSINQRNIGSQLNNTMSSSINYSKQFETNPKLNLSVNASHRQNINTKTVDLNLPSVTLNMEQIFPFAPKSGIKKGVFQNINLRYTFQGKNEINTVDSLLFKKEVFNNMKNGINHRIPLTTNFKLFKYLSVSMSGNYNETWVFSTIRKEFSVQENKVIDERINGFDSYRTYNFSSNLGTTIYGTFVFGKNSKIQAIRHTIRPSLSYTYTPSFDNFYDEYVVIDANGTTLKEYTRFQNSIFSPPNKNKANILNFSVGNNIEAKIRDDESENNEPKKITILNTLNFSGNYNMTADSLKFSPVNMSASTRLFKEKLQVNVRATLDPYALDANGKKIDKWNINNNGSLFRMSIAELTMNYSFSSSDPIFGSNTGNTSQNQRVQSGGRADDLFGQGVNPSSQNNSMFDDDSEDVNKTPSKLYHNDIPWDLTIAYSLGYNNSRRQNEISSNSIMFSGNVSLSPGWRVGFSSGYDFKQNGVTFTQLRFERDLKSWRMDFSWTPVGYYKQWNFFIGIKSNILQDLKYEKRRLPDRRYN